jgi:hypothetical protein
MIYCGIHEADHTPAEFSACLTESAPATPAGTGTGEDD